MTRRNLLFYVKHSSRLRILSLRSLDETTNDYSILRASKESTGMGDGNRQIYVSAIDLPIVYLAGHHCYGLTVSLFFFCVSFFFQGQLRFFLSIWLLLIVFFAHDILLDTTYSYSTASLRIVNRLLTMGGTATTVGTISAYFLCPSDLRNAPLFPI